MKINKSALLTSAFSALALTLTGHAATPVIIDPIVSTGTTEEASNKESNIWFTIDDSGSMGSMGAGKTSRYDRGRNGRLVYGYSPYVPTVEYENYIPVDQNGKKLPLPSDVNKTYTLGHNSKFGFNTPKDIFVSYAEDKMGVKVCYGNNCSTPRYQEINIRDTYKVLEEQYLGVPFTALVEKDRTCDLASNKKRCQVWKTYYSTRLLALKSGLALSMYHSRDKKYRFGFQELWGKDKKGNDKYPGPNKNYFPDVPRIQTFPLLENNENNRTEFFKWLFTLTPDRGSIATTTRKVVSSLFRDIKNNAINDNANNIFLHAPGQSHDPKKNPKLTCRQNHNIIFTDGQWEDSYWPSNVTGYMSDYRLGENEKTENSLTLEDGNQYSPRRPYTANKSSVYNLADIAFAGWITDLDNNKKNNKEGQTGAVVEFLAEFKNKKGETTQKDNYWLHFNDPATWQHINTHTIGFALNESKYPKISINPPKTVKEAKALDSSFGLNSFIRGTRKWVRSYSHKIPVEDAVADLARAAITGRGLHYNAQTGEDIIEAFENILDRATDGGGSKPGVKGSGGVTGSSQFGLDGHYTTSYENLSFTGELTKYKLFDGKDSSKASCFKSPSTNEKFGQLCDKPAWEAGKVLTSMAAEDRHIFSSKQQELNKDLKKKSNIYDVDLEKLSYKQIKFLSKEMSGYQKKVLIDNYTGPLKSYRDSQRLALGLKKANSRARNALVNYTWGLDSFNLEKSGHFRQRIVEDPDTKVKYRNILGSMMRSAPKFVGVPFIGNNHPKLLDPDFVSFVKNYIYQKDGSSLGANPVDKDYINMIYVGSNDGMLHAFRAKDGKEVFAYIPNAIYKALPKLVDRVSKTSFVDGGIDVQTFKLGSNWKQVLVGAMGGGAKGLYSLDVTNPKGYIDNKTPIARWEYTEEESKLFQAKELGKEIKDVKSNMGNIIASPGSVELSDGTAVTIVGNGYNSESNKATLIVINLETGKPIQELVLDNKYTDDSQPNGLAPVTFLSYAGKKENTHQPDRAYAGDLQGNLWVFDLTSATKDGGITVINNKPLFIAQYKDSDGNTTKQPITVAPLVKEHPTKYGFLVHFGTGSLFAENDISSNINNSIYAIWDDWVPSNKSGIPTPRDSVVKRSHLRTVKFKNIIGQSGTTKNGVTTDPVRLLDDSDDAKKAIQWAVSGTEFSTKRRGWKIDLLKGERAWQPAYTDYGAESVTSISYNTVKYHDKKENPTPQLTCGVGESGVTSWSLAFNEKDAAQPLNYSGVIDANSDGTNTEDDKIDLGDKTSTPISGLQIKDITFNPAKSNLYATLAIFGGDDDTGGGDPGDGTTNPPAGGGNTPPSSLAKVCTWKNSLSSSALSSNIVVKQNCVRSHTGSWVELRGE